MKEAAHIVFVINERHVPYLAVSLYSLLYHSSPDNEYHIHIILEAEGGGKAQNKLLNIAAAFPQARLDFVVPSAFIIARSQALKEATADAFFQKIHPDLPRLIFYRLFLADMLPSCRKIIHLDCDTLICCDIAELYHTDLKGLPVGAIPDAGLLSSDLKSRFARHNISAPRSYFNAGVHIQDLELFRNQGIGGRAASLLEQHSFDFIEQDALNVVLDRHWLRLGLEWNFSLPLFRISCPESYDSVPERERQEGEEIERHGRWKIIHYAYCKPWTTPALESGSPVVSLWWRFAVRTPGFADIFRNKLDCDLKRLRHELRKQKVRRLFSFPAVKRKRRNKIDQLAKKYNFLSSCLNAD